MKRGERVKERLAELKRYNEANSIKPSKEFGECFVCGGSYPPKELIHFCKDGEAHVDCFEYNIKRGLPTPRHKVKKRCIECRLPVYGSYLVYLDEDPAKPIHNRCIDNHRKIEELFK